jgi:serine/threonine protein kinase
MEQGNTLIGKTLGTCSLSRLIGRGGMGTVYLAEQSRPLRQVAVKVLLPDVSITSEVYREFLARFQREANVIAQLEHINIMPIYEYGEQDGLAYLVMPYLTRGTLRDVLSQRGSLPLQVVADYLDQAAAALDYAHAHKIIHRDLKPANFLLHNDGRLVLTDFGIARLIQDSDTTHKATLTSTGMFLGTPEYMAPEMVLGEPLDHRVDIYGLGIVLFQMLSGQVPFKGNTPFAVANRHLQEPPPSLHQLNPAISPSVDNVIQTAIAKKREDRFQSAGVLARAFHQAIAEGDLAQAGNQNAPTFLSPLPHTNPIVSTAPLQAEFTVQQNIPSNIGRGIGTSPAGSTPYPQTPITPYPTPLQRNRPQTALVLIGVLLAIALIIGGILIGLQVNRNGLAGNTNASQAPASTSHSIVNQATVTAPVATLTATTGPATATSIATQAANGVPKGGTLYSTTAPGSQCDKSGGSWADYNKPIIACTVSSTEISNPYTQSPNLVGAFLTTLPGNTYPSDYVVEAQLQPASSSNADFGIYFRNQPGNQEGVYTFFIHSDGTWRCYVYDNVTGAQTEVSSGTFGDAHALVTVDVVVIGSHFTFYANGHEIGSASDGTYSKGTAGIAVDAGGTIYVNRFALYLPS